jgi:hypothetical protein
MSEKVPVIPRDQLDLLAQKAADRRSIPLPNLERDGRRRYLAELPSGDSVDFFVTKDNSQVTVNAVYPREYLHGTGEDPRRTRTRRSRRGTAATPVRAGR